MWGIKELKLRACSWRTCAEEDIEDKLLEEASEALEA